MKNNLGKVGFYIHWPFCIKKCYYCDLNSYVDNEINKEDFFYALLLEIEYWQSKFQFQPQTIFFGGGTPSLMKTEWIQRIIESVKNGVCCDDIEITVEANPVSSELFDFHMAQLAGINRISFGVQSFCDDVLIKIGRTHKRKDAIDIINKAHQVFDRVSIDLMYALPGCKDQDAIDSLNLAIQLGVKHISIYEFTLHQNTVFGQKYRRNQLKLHKSDDIADTYERIRTTMHKAKLQQYEISSFAQPMHQSQHNLCYWNYKTFIGIGPGAHSRILTNNGVYAVKNYDLPNHWLKNVHQHGQGIEEYNCLDECIVEQEKLMMHMRLIEGVDYNIIDKLCVNFNQKLQDLENACLLYQNDTKIKLTHKGQLVLNSILRYLLD